MRPVPLLAALLLAGCVSTRPATVSTPEGRAYLNERAGRGHPVLALWGERGRQVRGLRIDADSARWVDKKTDEAPSAPIAQIETITFRRDGRGALKGVAVGAGLGVAMGALIASGDDGDFSIFDFSLGEGIALGMLSTVPISALVGAIHSDRDVHRVVPPGAVASGETARPCAVPMTCTASAGPLALPDRGPGQAPASR